VRWKQKDLCCSGEQELADDDDKQGGRGKYDGDGNTNNQYWKK
jgi:hypothetical protein